MGSQPLFSRYFDRGARPKCRNSASAVARRWFFLQKMNNAAPRYDWIIEYMKYVCLCIMCIYIYIYIDLYMHMIYLYVYIYDSNDFDWSQYPNHFNVISSISKFLPILGFMSLWGFISRPSPCWDASCRSTVQDDSDPRWVVPAVWRCIEQLMIMAKEVQRMNTLGKITFWVMWKIWIEALQGFTSIKACCMISLFALCTR